MNVQIYVTAGPAKGQTFVIHENQPALIGRGEEATIQIEDPSVSRGHCRISSENNRFFLEDVGSRAGTLVNNQAIAKHPLKHNDVVTLGATQLRIDLMGAAARPATQAKADVPSTQAFVDIDAGSAAELPADRMHELTGTALSHYQIGPLIAKGQSGMLFLAADTKDNREIALKVLWPDFGRDDEAVQRFVRAIKTMLPIKHPNLMIINGAGKTGPYCWISMEYVPGESITQIIKATDVANQLDWRQTLRVAVHVARAVAFAHQHKIIHRNITPHNIVIRAEDRVAKLGDLMLAKALEGKMAQQITAQGQLLGDLRYMAPERTSGLSTDVDGRSDIYALGATIYALLTGRPPLEGKSMMETILKIRQETPPLPSSFLPHGIGDFEHIIMKTLAKEPADRYQQASDLLAELEALAQTQGVQT